MSLHLQREMELLRKRILSLGGMVEENLALAVKSLEKNDQELVRRVTEIDDEVDRREIDVEEECLKVLALHQPVAVDLRFIISIIKINNDLERIGDLAVNIANKAHRVYSVAGPVTAELPGMGENARRMLKNALDALVNISPSLAQLVRDTDDDVDLTKRSIRDKVMEEVSRNPDQARALWAVHGVARNLERIADLAVNIAEDVIYMANGEIVRHQRDCDRDMD